MTPRSMESRCIPASLSGWLLFAFISIFPAFGANNRINQAVDDSRRVTLAGHVNPRIQSAVDQGPVASSMQLPYVTLGLRPSPAQQADLDAFVAQQQDPSSPSYHKWLTPEEFAERFGVSQDDIDKIVAWLGQHNLTVKSVARGRNAIAFGGAAGDVGAAFGVAIHHYQTGVELHYANATAPAIPAAFQGVVSAIHGLSDFRMKPHSHLIAQPRETVGGGEHQLAPGDVATIYDLTPLYNAGIDGTGQKIAVAGQTQIQLTDIENFRSLYGLPANDPTTTLVPRSQDPGISKDDLGEADLDVELSGAVAKNATIVYVYTADVMDSLQYIIDQNLAPAVSISYGLCEVQSGSAEAQSLAAVITQANAQGQTIFAASGDNGAADCFDPTDKSTNDGNTSVAVDLPASLPQVTGVGGTEFNEGSGTYWNAKNTAAQASALSYIPEITWNDSRIDGSPSASGGGASLYFAKPAWQAGTGVPSDGARDVPDVLSRPRRTMTAMKSTAAAPPRSSAELPLVRPSSRASRPC